MKSRYITRKPSPRLILLFAGWGMDWRPFAGLHRDGYDIMVIWDYKELSFNWRGLLRYDEICLIAWSTGVFAAAVTVHEIEPRITMRIAVNGTLEPIDDARGIPPAAWGALRNTLSPKTWWRYQRSMCDSERQYLDFCENSPRRTIADLADEMDALDTHALFHVQPVTDWDMAVVSTRDAVFPPQNQCTAWKGIAPTRMLDAGHFPDFQQIIDRLVIDKDYVERCFERGYDRSPEAEPIFDIIDTDLMECFDGIFGNGMIVGNVIEAGCGKFGTLTRKWYHRTHPCAKIRLWDIVHSDTGQYAPRADFEKCDAEVRMKRQPSDSAGFIFSSSCIQWFNSPREFLKECCRVLVPGGFLAVSSFVNDNLSELVSVTGKGLQLPTMKGWRNIIPPGMELLACENRSYRLSFESPRQILEYLRDMGVNGVNYGKSPAAIARKVLAGYPRDPETDLCMLTFEPVYIILRKFSEPGHGL